MVLDTLNGMTITVVFFPAYAIIVTGTNPSQRRIGMSYKRQAEEKRRLRKTYDATRHSCIGGVYYDKRKKR